MRHIRIVASVAAVFIAAAWPLASAQKPLSLQQLLKLAADYVADYARRTSGVVLEEEYVLIELGPRMQVPRRIGSDAVFINVNGSTNVLRDVYALDTQPTRERVLRINDILREPTLARWQQAQDFARQGQFHFLSELVVHISEPTIALQVLAEDYQPRFTFRLDGRKAMNGVPVSGVRFEEPKSRGAVYFMRTRGNAAASGRIWIDEKTGAVHQTELWIESPTEIARATVNYGRYPSTEYLLPTETTETYESRELGGGPSTMGVGSYNQVHRIEGKARYSNARFQAIDLTKMR